MDRNIGTTTVEYIDNKPIKKLNILNQMFWMIHCHHLPSRHHPWFVNVLSRLVQNQIINCDPLPSPLSPTMSTLPPTSESMNEETVSEDGDKQTVSEDDDKRTDEPKI